MKKMVFFLFASLLLLQAPCVLAQSAEIYARRPADSGFFIPQQELQPRYERLPQIRTPQAPLRSAVRPENSKAQKIQEQTQPRVRRYIAVDGRYIPVFEKEDKASAQNETAVSTDFAETPPKEGNDTTQDLISENTPKELAQTESAEPEPEISVPQSVPQGNIPSAAQPAPPEVKINTDLPDYRNAYGHYLRDLAIFRQTGQMPLNEALENTLSKLNSDAPIILYQYKP